MVLNRWERTETYISIASLTAAASVFTGALLFEARPYHRIFLSSSAIVLSATGLICHNTRGKDARRYSQLAINSQWEKALILSEHGLEDLYKRLHPRAAKEMTAELETEPMPALPPADNLFYNWDNLSADLTCAMVAGNTGYGKSSVVLWLLGKLTEREPAIIKVLDPHAVKNNWSDYGLTVVSDFGEIEQELLAIEQELDRRRMQPGDYPPIILVLDELGACMDNFQDPKKVAKINRRIASEGRKFDITGIVANQSDNCSAIGLDSKYKANYTQIFVGELARRQFKKATPEYEILRTAAYPCAVSGNVPETPAIHPTHGHHKRFKKKDNPPEGLLPINQITGDLPASDRTPINSPNSPTINLDKTGELEGKILTAAKRSPIFQVQILELEDELEADKIKIFEAFKSLAAKGFGYVVENPKIELTEFSLPEKYKAEFFGVKLEPEPATVALEKIYSNADDLPANVLTQAEWELYGLAAGSGPLSVRDAQRSAVARREGWNAEKIKEIFHRFSELGLGRAIPGKNGSLEFSP